jgi:hypothetical protein
MCIFSFYETELNLRVQFNRFFFLMYYHSKIHTNSLVDQFLLSCDLLLSQRKDFLAGLATRVPGTCAI